jgi:hypothetical protein
MWCGRDFKLRLALSFDEAQDGLWEPKELQSGVDGLFIGSPPFRIIYWMEFH